MGGCCNDSDCGNDTEARSLNQASHISIKDNNSIVETGCCEGSACGCDDACFDELARVICADDEAHLHDEDRDVSAHCGDGASCCGDSGEDGGHSDSVLVPLPRPHTHQAATSDCTCCGTSEEKVKHDVEHRKVEGESTPLPSAIPAAGYEHAGLRKRSVGETQYFPPKQACGEHRTIARSRYNDTLAAFGCICKALLARGLSTCCTPAGLTGKAVARSNSTTRSARLILPGRTSSESPRSGSIHSCCGKSDCGGPALSIKSVPYRGHVDARSLSAKGSRSRLSVDSCCRGDCCGAGSCDESASARDEKSEHVTVDIEKAVGTFTDHVVLAIKGMTCTGCENKLTRILRGIPTIGNVKTSLVLCRAEFDFDSDITDVVSLVQLIEKRSGFSAEVMKAGSTRELLLTVAQPLQEKFMAMDAPLGVEAIVRADKDNLLVTYDPNVISARNVLTFYASFSPILAPEPPDPALLAGAKHIRTLSLRAALSAILTIPVLVMTWAPLPPHPHAYAIACLVLATVVQLVITGPFYVSSVKSLVLYRLVETEMLIVLSTTAAYVYSVVAFAFDMTGQPFATGEFFETSTLLVTLIMVGQVVSAIARQRAIEAISIRSLQERTACVVLTDGSECEVDVRLLHYDDTFKVLPDSAIITDGEVVTGSSTVDESMMTGESRPVEKGPGSMVIAGTLNGPSTLLIKVTRLPGENTISDIAKMVDDARFSRAHVQEIVDWVCGWFVPVVLVLAGVTFAVWIAVGIAVRHQSRGDAAVAALTYAISVLAVSCPCAIGLAVPMVILIAGGVGAKLGLVFKAASTIEQARKVNHVVLDKTGTVTQGRLSVVDRFIDSSAGFDVSAAVGHLVASSRHPVARAVAADLSAPEDSRPSVEDVEMITGKGMQGTLLGLPLRGGSAQWLGLESHPAVQPFIAESLTTFCVVHADRLVAAFGLSDTLRPEAHDVIRSLTARHIRVSILSGDHPNAVFTTAARLGIPAERVRAGCLPADKQAYVRELAAQGDTVLFCGDGTNDAVALAQAAIGVHLHTGAEGAGVAASTAADVVLTHPSLTGLLTLLELSDAVARRVALNFAWSFGYNLCAILLAAGAFVRVRIAPAYAGLGEIVSVLPVVLVALQLKWFKPAV